MHLVLWGSPYSKGSAPSSFSLSHRESVGVWGFQLHCGSTRSSWRSCNRLLSPRWLSFQWIHSVLMKHARLWPQRLRCSLSPQKECPRPRALSKASLCPCRGKKAACEPVMRYFPSHSEQRCLSKVVNRGQPVQGRPAMYLALGLLSITFQMHWLPSLAGLSLT